MAVPPDDWKPPPTPMCESDFALPRYDFNIEVPSGASHLALRYGMIETSDGELMIRFGRWVMGAATQEQS